MRKHSPEKIARVKEYRKKGCTLYELVEKFSIPKTTIWHHIENLDVKAEHKRKWQTMRGKKGGEKSHERSQKAWEKAEKEAQDILSDIRKEEIMPVLFSSLYWAEGKTKGEFVFTNTDEKMIKVFLRALREFLKVKSKNITLLIRITRQHDKKRATKYWQKITGVPISNIKIDCNDKQNKSSSIYGMCRVSVRNGGYLLKLAHGLRKELIHKMER